MDDAARQALRTDMVIDITTIGRRSGEPRRIETWFYDIDGTVYLSGRPGRRGWYANLLANPGFTFHLKQSVTADLEATAVAVTDPARREPIIREIHRRIESSVPVDEWLAGSPLVRVDFG